MYVRQFFSAAGKALRQLKNRMDIELTAARQKTGNAAIVGMMEENLHGLNNLIAVVEPLQSFAQPVEDTFVLITRGHEVIRCRTEFWNGTEWVAYATAVYDRREDDSGIIPGVNDTPMQAVPVAEVIPGTNEALDGLTIRH